MKKKNVIQLNKKTLRALAPQVVKTALEAGRTGDAKAILARLGK
jgi:hypothetical protein